MKSSLGIPSVDLSDFLSGDESRKNKFVADLGAAYEDIGFVSLKNHGFKPELQNSLYKEVQNFFSLPKEIKLGYEIPGIAGQRGYVSFGKESAKGSNHPDLKEFWHFGQYINEDFPIEEKYPDNVEVKELTDFNSVGEQAYKQLETTGRSMLQALALYLNLDEYYFDEKIVNGNSILRPIHYPPIVGEPSGSVRAGQHEDINLITLLMGASADGLQVLNKQNEWVSVTAIEDHIIVNVGDMLQRLTNNKLRSTTHRVINPPKEKWGESRFSIPFFLHPRAEVSLACLESCITEENPKQYDDITAGGYLRERLIELGLIKE
ncbi:MAG: isopenicillin N synthase family dioxygenase [Flavobacteriales bacterium]